MYLRYATASQEICLGRFVDSTDGNTEETGLTINNTDIKLHKHGATTLADKNSGGGTHIANGLYYAVLDDTDTNTLGNLEVHVHVSGALAVSRAYTVLPAKIFDSLVLGTDNLEVDAIQLSGDTTAADNAESFFDGTGYAGTGNIIPTVTAVTNEVTANVTKISGDATAADNAEAFFDGTGYAGTNNVIPTVTSVTNEVSADVTKISGDATAADNAESFFDGTGYAGTGNIIPTVTTVNGLGNDVITAASIATGAIDADALADGASQELIELMFTYDATATYGTAHAGSLVKQIADNAGGSSLTLGDIADAVWDEAMAGHTTAGTTGEKLDDAGTAGDPWNTALPGAYGAGTAGKIVGDNLNAPVGTVDTVVDAIKAKTDNLPASPAATGDIPSAATIRAEIDSNSTQLAAIVADTNELQTDITNGGRIDLLIDAIVADTNELQTDITNGGRVDLLIDGIKAKTDNLPSDPADASDIAASFVTVNNKLDAIDDYVDTEVAAIKAKTDNIPASPAAVSDIPSAAAVASQVRTELTTELGRIDATISSRASQLSLDTLDDYVDTEVNAIKVKTDNLPASPAATADIPSAAAVASQVRTELTTELGRIDATVSSRASQASLDTLDDYVDTEVAAIKAKTDNLPASPASTSDIPTADITAIKAQTDKIVFTGTDVKATLDGETVTVGTNNDKTGYSLTITPPTSAQIADAVWDEAVADHQAAGSTGEGLTAYVPPTVEQIRTEMDDNSTKLAAIQAKTANIPNSIADEVWNEPIAGHLTPGTTGAQLNDSAGIAGANSVTVTVEDDASSPIPDVAISIYNDSMTTLLDMKVSDVNGQAVFALDNDTYKVSCRKAGWSFTIPETMVVSGVSTKDIEGTSVFTTIPSPPATAQVCRVYEYLINADDQSIPATAESEAEIVNLPYDLGGRFHSGQEIDHVYNPVTGLIYWDIVYGADVRMSITDFMPSRIIRVAEETTKRLADMLDDDWKQMYYRA